jgi:hypothetical protein
MFRLRAGRLKEICPDVNLLFVGLDAGAAR